MHESRVADGAQPHHISDVAIELLPTVSLMSADDILRRRKLRRTLFHYASKNAIPWGDFSTHLAQPLLNFSTISIHTS